jgi:DNA polymerase/3'-5' exonuclease PolX
VYALLQGRGSGRKRFGVIFHTLGARHPTQRVLPDGMTLDLFMADADNWGWQLCLRTGSAGLNQHVFLRAMKHQGYVAEDGYLKRGGQVISTLEEVDVFRLLRLPWVDPWAREV